MQGQPQQSTSILSSAFLKAGSTRKGRQIYAKHMKETAMETTAMETANNGTANREAAYNGTVNREIANNGTASMEIADKGMTLPRRHKGICKVQMSTHRSGKTASIVPHRTVFKVPLGLGRHPFDFLTNQMENWKDYNYPDYYNYGFNSQTIVPYILLLKKFTEAQNIGSPVNYSTQGSELLRLNDEVPMDFGGFSPPIDQDLFDVPGCSSFSKGEPLFMCLVQQCVRRQLKESGQPEPDKNDFKISPKDEPFLLEFVRSMYHREDLNVIRDRILGNLSRKYEESVEVIRNHHQAMGREAQEELKAQHEKPNPYSHIVHRNHDSSSTQHQLLLPPSQHSFSRKRERDYGPLEEPTKSRAVMRETRKTEYRRDDRQREGERKELKREESHVKREEESYIWEQSCVKREETLYSRKDSHVKREGTDAKREESPYLKTEQSDVIREESDSAEDSPRSPHKHKKLKKKEHSKRKKSSKKHSHRRHDQHRKHSKHSRRDRRDRRDRH